MKHIDSRRAFLSTVTLAGSACSVLSEHLEGIIEVEVEGEKIKRHAEYDKPFGKPGTLYVNTPEGKPLEIITDFSGRGDLRGHMDEAIEIMNGKRDLGVTYRVDNVNGDHVVNPNFKREYDSEKVRNYLDGAATRMNDYITKLREFENKRIAENIAEGFKNDPPSGM